VYGNNYPRRRSPSPLRSGFKVDPDTGEIHSEDGSDDDNDDDLDPAWGRRSQSPNPSITQFASSFAQRVGSFVSSVGSAVTPGLPTDEELERQAERDRERSRREAERILTQEAEERRIMEEKVFAMMQTTRSSPARSPSMPPFEHPSPTPSQRESGVSWWTATKNRLTPTKEPLTAAQQVIQETKEKEKREKKGAKKAEKEKKRSVDWPATPEDKFTNPTLLSLVTPPKPSPNHASHSAPSSPTPGSHQGLPISLPPSLAPSPLRPPDSRTASPSRSPSRDPPPLYAQFNDQGTLDVPGTLLVIARRFEKLEKWTVGHVRALEERMGDVERWLVEKENEKEGQVEDAATTTNGSSSSALEGTVNDMRDELMEMQGRIGELGREVAKFVTSPAVLSTMPSRVSAQAVSTAPQTNSSFAIHAQTSSSITVHSHSLPPNTPQPSVSRISSYSDLRRRDSVSPPFVPPSAIRAEQPRSRLPYPTGDYASPPGSVVVGQVTLSSPQSPPTTSNSASGSPAGAVRSRPVSVAGLPAASPPPLASAPAGLPRAVAALVAPPQPARARSSSISPTPRKRYTVALGEPIMKPRLTASPSPISVGDEETEEDEGVEHTIGRSAGRHASAQYKREPTRTMTTNGVGLGFGHNGNGNGNGDDTDTSTDSAPLPPPRRVRQRAQTQTGSPSAAVDSRGSRSPPSVAAAASRTNPLRLHGRAQSTDRRVPLDAASGGGGGSARTPRTPRSAMSSQSLSSAASASGFRDPILVRREESEARAKAAPAPPKVFAGKPRAPVGQLVAYFDKS